MNANSEEQHAGEDLLHDDARQRPGQGARLLHERPWLRAAGGQSDPRRAALPHRRSRRPGLPAGSVAGDTRAGAADTGNIPPSCTIETDDLRKAYEALQSRGVKFETEVLEFPWGYVAQFDDPDGN